MLPAKKRTLDILNEAQASILQAIEDTALLHDTPLDDTSYHVNSAIASLARLRPIELPRIDCSETSTGKANEIN